MVGRFHPKGLIGTFPFRVSEWVLSGIMFAWGVVALLVPEMFDHLIAFGMFTTMAPQPVWGVAATLTGIIGLGALAVNGAVRSTPHIRAVCALARGWVWLLIIVGLAASAVPNPGLVVYPGLLLLEIYNVLRAAGDAKISDDLARSAG